MPGFDSQSRGLVKRLVISLWLAVAVDCVSAQICSAIESESIPLRQLIVLAGQSNAVGLASVNDAGGSLAGAYGRHFTRYPNVQIYGVLGAMPGATPDDPVQSRLVDWSAAAKWHQAQPGFGYKNPRVGERNPAAMFGPELYLAHALNSRQPFDHYILKLAVSGTSLSAREGQDSWAPGGHLYKQLVKMVGQAHHAAKSRARLNVQAFVFLQGESDSQSLSEAKRYESNLRHLIKSFRSDMYGQGCAVEREFPVIISRVQDNAHWRYRHIVRRAQQTVAVDLPNVRLINTDDLTDEMINEGYAVHFNKYGQAHIGLRIYDSLFAGAP